MIRNKQREDANKFETGPDQGLSWKEITQAVAKAWDTDWERAKEAHRSGARAAALYVSRHYLDHSLRELGQLVGGVEYPAVTMAIRRFERRLQVDKKLMLPNQETRKPSKPRIENVES